jgi:hypothetical protein
MKNQMREEVLAEIRNRWAWNIRHDKKAVLIGLIKLANAAWIAGLWQIGFPTGIPLLLWLGFFASSMAFAWHLEQRRAQQENAAGSSS